MTESRSGHHGDVCYVFEDAGYDTTPNDTNFKTFGSNAVVDTFEAARQAERKFNAGRRAVEIIRQNFDGGWGVTFELSEPPWWLAGIFGQPATTNVAGNQYEHDYDLDNGNDPVSLRLYEPTDGFSNYYVTPGAWIVSAEVNAPEGESPEVTLVGGYGREPFEDDSLSPSAPDLSQSTFSSRDAELLVDTDSVGRVQNTTVSLETGAEGVSELGTDKMIDFVPHAFEPEVTWEKIRWVGETVDAHQRFIDANSVTTELDFDNGETGDSKYAVEIDVLGSFPNEWTESNRNDPDANLLEELAEMGEDATVLVTSDDATPPGV